MFWPINDEGSLCATILGGQTAASQCITGKATSDPPPNRLAGSASRSEHNPWDKNASCENAADGRFSQRPFHHPSPSTIRLRCRLRNSAVLVERFILPSCASCSRP